MYKIQEDPDFEGDYRPMSVSGHIAWDYYWVSGVLFQTILHLESQDFILQNHTAYLKRHSTQTSSQRRKGVGVKI